MPVLSQIEVELYNNDLLSLLFKLVF